MTDQNEYFFPAAGEQDQAEQGAAQEWMDDELKRILSSLVDKLSVRDLTLLCNALKIDVRDIS